MRHWRAAACAAFIPELGPSADSAAAAYSASRIHSATSSTAHEPQIAQVQRAVKDIQGLFTAHGLISAFLGTNPAVVLHAEPQSAAEASESPTERTGDASGWEKPPARLVAWPLGAPEAFMRHVELKHAGREKLSLHAASADPFIPTASCLPDFAYQPPHDDVVAVVWGTPSFWAALSVDAVCSLIAAFVQTQETQEEDASLFLQEEAADFLLRKALVQAVVKREKTVKELLHHPAALRAAGLPHWEDPLMEAEQRAALGNKKAEIALMRRVIAAQEEYLKRKSGPFRFAKQPFFDSGEKCQMQLECSVHHLWERATVNTFDIYLKIGATALIFVADLFSGLVGGQSSLYGKLSRVCECMPWPLASRLRLVWTPEGLWAHPGNTFSSKCTFFHTWGFWCCSSTPLQSTTPRATARKKDAPYICIARGALAIDHSTPSYDMRLTAAPMLLEMKYTPCEKSSINVNFPVLNAFWKQRFFADACLIEEGAPNPPVPIPPVQPRFVALALSGSHFSSTRERGPPEAPIVGPLPPFPEVFSPMAHRLRAPFCFSGSAQGVVSGLRGSSGACCELVERKNLLGADQGETSPFFLTRNAVFLASALSCGCPSRTAGPHCCGFAAFATATSDPLGASGRAPPSSRAAGKGASESDANAVSKGQRVGEEGEALQQAVEEAFCVFGVIYRHAQKAPSSARSATSAAASPAVTSSSASTQTTAPAENQGVAICAARGAEGPRQCGYTYTAGVDSSPIAAATTAAASERVRTAAGGSPPCSCWLPAAAPPAGAL
ncbi:uncharacterized protein LOC34622570 [Cyclospora cayetanensis]|uniref:Uncharacterized protein LOC34622570 n=1 Tax=Cyclospora cayetanensis TaxID=88456 RepID=A0A6P6RZ77_9EIME|nr:uncharacterized protein LOC34622570 [Cyclospora cayetanensis]